MLKKILRVVVALVSVTTLLIPIYSSAQSQEKAYKNFLVEGLERFPVDVPGMWSEKKNLLIVRDLLLHPESDDKCKPKFPEDKCILIRTLTRKGKDVYLAIHGSKENLAVAQQELLPRIGKYRDWKTVVNIALLIEGYREGLTLSVYWDEIRIEGRFVYDFNKDFTQIENYEAEVYRNFNRKGQ